MVQNLRKCLQTLQKKWNGCELGPHPYQLMATPHMQTWQLEEMTKWRSKLVLISTAESSFCVEAITFTKVSGLPPWMRNRLVEQKDSVLLISTLTASEGLLIAASLAFCIVRSRLILLYNGHLKGGQTVKNYLVHMCISIRTLTANIMMSSISTWPGSFFRGFIFAGTG